MIVCCICGQAGRHFRCLQSNTRRRQWECEVCASVEDRQTDLSATLEQSSPESKPDSSLPGTMQIYETCQSGLSTSSLDSLERRFSSPRDQMFFLDSTDDMLALGDCSQLDVLADKEPHLESGVSKQHADEEVTHSGSESEGSVIFVGEVLPHATALLRRNVRPYEHVDLQAETDSDPSDPEPTVYGLSFERSLRQL